MPLFKLISMKKYKEKILKEALERSTRFDVEQAIVEFKQALEIGNKDEVDLAFCKTVMNLWVDRSELSIAISLVLK